MADVCSVMYSTSYSAGIAGMMETFGISNKTLLVLGITTYLFGLALGSIILAPLSEMYGRRPIYLISMALFTILVLPCALAQNLEAILVTRFFGALAGSAMISNAPGTVGDIVSDEYRALAFSIWSIGPMNGPVIGMSHTIIPFRPMAQLTSDYRARYGRFRLPVSRMALDELGRDVLLWCQSLLDVLR